MVIDEPSISSDMVAMVTYQARDGSRFVLRLDCGVLQRFDGDWTTVAVLHPGHGSNTETGSGPEARPVGSGCEDLIRAETEPDPIVFPSDTEPGRFRFCIDGATADSMQSTQTPWTTQCVEFEIVEPFDP